MCENQTVRIKLKNGKVIYQKIKDIERELTENIKQWNINNIINRTTIFIGCGKCDYCLTLKKTNYQKRVSHQFKNSKYSYLITLTLNNENIRTLQNKIERNYLKALSLSDNTVIKKQADYNISQLSTISKIQINNIIKNWKNKLNRYYKTKVSFNYLLCGEYGGNTERAHYHIILLLDHPLPNLIKQPVAGQHYKAELFNSKQYGHYDIEPLISDNPKKTTNYITKYLTKSIIDNPDKTRLNIFQEELLEYYIQNNIPLDTPLIKNKEQFIKLYLYLTTPNAFKEIPEFTLTEIKYQKEFIKISRNLGISDNHIENIKNNTFTPYQKEKYLKNRYGNENLDYVKKYYNDYLLTDDVLRIYERKRQNNIKKHFGKTTLIKKQKSKTDIW